MRLGRCCCRGRCSCVEVCDVVVCVLSFCLALEMCMCYIGGDSDVRQSEVSGLSVARCVRVVYDVEIVR